MSRLRPAPSTQSAAKDPALASAGSPSSSMLHSLLLPASPIDPASSAIACDGLLGLRSPLGHLAAMKAGRPPLQALWAESPPWYKAHINRCYKCHPSLLQHTGINTVVGHLVRFGLVGYAAKHLAACKSLHVRSAQRPAPKTTKQVYHASAHPYSKRPVPATCLLLPYERQSLHDVHGSTGYHFYEHRTFAVPPKETCLCHAKTAMSTQPSNC